MEIKLSWGFRPVNEIAALAPIALPDEAKEENEFQALPGPPIHPCW